MPMALWILLSMQAWEAYKRRKETAQVMSAVWPQIRREEYCSAGVSMWSMKLLQTISSDFWDLRQYGSGFPRYLPPVFFKPSSAITWRQASESRPRRICAIGFH